MLWLSADFSKDCSGIALWAGNVLANTYTVKVKGKLGKHVFAGQTYGSQVAAWQAAFTVWPRGALVYEGGLGHNMKTARILAEHRGGVLMLWRLNCSGPMIAANVKEWRRVACETWPGLSWPADRERCKATAVSLVKEHFGRDVSADEADAVLVGHWALRTRAVEVAP